MKTYCCECKKEVGAKLVDGTVVYPHRTDLAELPFWQCPECKNYVGCHHKTKDRTRPLGVIPNERIRDCRKKIHAVLDPLWKSGKYKRKDVYERLSEKLGFEYHTAMLRNEQECFVVFAECKRMEKDQ